MASIAGYLLASRSLRPVETMARKAEAITSDKLHERLEVNDSDGELADLARAFNVVLVRLEQSFEQLRRFTSDASHELRTPLAAMRSVGEVGLRKGGGAVEFRDVIGSMLEESNKLTRLVDSLLVIARADAGQTRLDVAVFSVGDLIRECASLFEALLDESGIRLTVEERDEINIIGDRLLLRQALVNVVHNAIKYTPRGGFILLRTFAKQDLIVLEVQDTGPGIPTEDLQKVFDRFYRVEVSRSRESGGTGLGLSIARWNVQAHGGVIEASRPACNGCLIRITLPASRAESLSIGARPVFERKDSNSVLSPRPSDGQR